MNFIYQRVVRFADTDGAGVVYFAKLLSICHEAYEASLSAAIDVRSFFSGDSGHDLIVPIVRAEIDFFLPIYCGDKLAIHLIPEQVNSGVFICRYEVFSSSGAKLAQAQTKHSCIHKHDRQKHHLSLELLAWLDRSRAIGTDET